MADGAALGVRGPPGCELRPSPGKGQGLFSNATHQVGSEVFSERPPFVMQHTENRRVVTACANCCRFVGLVGGQLDALFRGAYTRELLGKAALDPLLQALDEHRGTWDAAAGGEPRGGRPQAGEVRCAQGCGEPYCSEACRDAHFRHSHNLLCVGPLEDEYHPLLRFKLHALQHSDTLLLVAQVLANLVNRAREGGDGAAVLRSLVAELKALCHAPFADICRPPRGQTRDEAFRERTNAWIGTAAELLEAALEAQAPGEALALFERGPALVSEVLGLFERNNVTVELASPLAAFFADRARALTAAGAESAADAAELRAVERLLRGKECLMRLARGEEMTGICDGAGPRRSGGKPRSFAEVEAEVGRMGLEQLLQAPWPAFYGDALAVAPALTNHSCAPNVKIKFLGSDSRLTAVALKPIAAGEELCYSYIQEEANLKARRRELLHWGFTCQCERCSLEDAGPERKVRRQRLK